jgi:hypothetical protein
MRAVRLHSVLLLVFALTGCATLKEVGKCVVGVSTKCLETTRKDAIKKTFNLDYATCQARTRDILKKTGAHIYAEDKAQDMIAVYVSTSDTTPVGIFFDRIDANNTGIEISGPSTDAKEIMSKRVFNAVEGKISEGEEGKVDAKELLGNK